MLIHQSTCFANLSVSSQYGCEHYNIMSINIIIIIILVHHRHSFRYQIAIIKISSIKKNSALGLPLMLQRTITRRSVISLGNDDDPFCLLENYTNLCAVFSLHLISATLTGPAGTRMKHRHDNAVSF